MKKQLLALAGAAALGLGAVAGNSAPSADVDPTARVGYAVAELASSPPDAIGAGFGAAGGLFGDALGRWLGQRSADYFSRPVVVAANTAARAAFTRGGILMGARLGGAIGAFGGPVGLVVGTAVGAL